MQQLKCLTEKLIERLDELHEHFNKKNEMDPKQENYFSYVKSELESTFHLLEEWDELVLQKIANKDLNIAESMIDSTRDNMKQLMMHSYYFDVRIRRYHEIKKSCLYVFYIILDEINT